MRRPPFAACALLAVAAGVALSACGSSSSSSSSSSSTSSAAPTYKFTPVGNNSSAFCTQVGAVVAEFSHIGSAFTSTSPGATPNVTTFKQILATEASALDALDSQAPGEIASAFHTFRAAFDQANAQAQSAQTFAEAGKVFTGFSQPAVKAAGSQITAYIQTKCGITPGAPTATP